MKNSHLSVVSLVLIIFLGFELTPAHADDANDANGVSIQNILIQPYSIKVGDTFTVTATLVNNSTVPIVVETGKCSSMDIQVPFFTVIFDNHAKSMAKNINCAGVGWSEILDPGKKITSTSPDYTLNYTAIKSGTTNVTVTFSYHAIIQKDPIQTGDEQTISKSFQFLIHDVNETYTQKPPVYFTSPLKQFKSGIKAEDVKCKQDLQLIFKSGDSSPICVKPVTANVLIERGWAFAGFTRGGGPVNPSTIQVKHADMIVIEDTGTTVIGNQTYYFTTLNDTLTSYHGIAAIPFTFHGVDFTLFPSVFSAGPPESCGDTNFGTAVKFANIPVGADPAGIDKKID